METTVDKDVGHAVTMEDFLSTECSCSGTLPPLARLLFGIQLCLALDTRNPGCRFTRSSLLHCGLARFQPSTSPHISPCFPLSVLHRNSGQSSFLHVLCHKTLVRLRLANLTLRLGTLPFLYRHYSSGRPLRSSSAMTKRHADSMADISPTDPNHPWVARGYRPDFAYSVRKARVEDPYGEVAYQRAFFEAAEAKSRRVPDPVLYHNSPSARKYIKRRDHAIFSAKPRNGNNQSSTPTTPSSTTTSTYSPAQLPSSIQHTSNGFPARRTNIKAEFEPVLSISSSLPDSRHIPQVSPKPMRPPTDPYRPYAPHGLPLTLEPKLDAPSGPSRMLR